MAQWHLDELENKLQHIGWKIILQIEKENRRAWIIKRSSEKIMEFNIFDHMGYPMPIEKAYGCDITGTEISLYFHNNGKMWEKALSAFIKELNDLC